MLAVGDLHVGYAENCRLVENLRPESEDDWLLIAGDVAERAADLEWVLRTVRRSFGTVIWVPGGHELWTLPDERPKLRGEAKYHHLVELCGRLGVLTPEDEYPVWEGPGGPLTVAPLFTLYDYTFRPEGAASKEEALERARAAAVVCTDERMLHPDPYPSREAWCDARIRQTEKRLADLGPDVRTVLLDHFPLVREPTRILRHQEYALWCGTERTADWHLRFNAAVVVHGHMHVSRTTWVDGVRFEDVSIGHPRGRWERSARSPGLRRIFPLAGAETGSRAWTGAGHHGPR